MARQLAVLLAILLLSGCAVKESYWTKPGAGERQFRSAGNRCFDLATDRIADEGNQRTCVFNSQYGTVCGRAREDPMQRERRLQSRLKQLWGRCMEEHGWTANHDGVGYQRS